MTLDDVPQPTAPQASTRRILLYAILLLGPLLVCLAEASASSADLLLRHGSSILAVVFIVLAAETLRHRSARFVTAFGLGSPLFLVGFAEAVSYRLQGQSFNPRFFFHLRPDVAPLGLKAYPWILALPILALLVLGLTDWHWTRSGHAQRHRVARWTAALAALLLLPNPAHHLADRADEHSAPSERSFEQTLDRLGDFDIRAESLITGPMLPSRITPDSPRNLILIYLEGVERSYLDNPALPNLLPRIEALIEEGLDLTNLHQFPGTEWTMGGLFGSLCGMPMPATRGNDIANRSPYIHSRTCLTDLLAAVDYRMVFMGGADTRFAGKGEFLESHGFDEVLGYYQLEGELPDTTPRATWGLFDESLLTLASERVREMASDSRPFALTLLTVDTHEPAGDPSPGCPQYPHSDNSMVQAVHCTDFLLGRFLDEIRELPIFANTLVFVLSDHLAMKNVADQLYPAERKLLAFALNTSQRGEVAEYGSHFDIAPTILSLLGLQAENAFPLGQDLLNAPDPHRLDIFRAGEHRLLDAVVEDLDQLQHGFQLCQERGIRLIDPEEPRIDLGGREVVISLQGNPALPRKGVFYARYTPAGQLVDLGILSTRQLANAVAQFEDNLYFFFTQGSRLPPALPGLGPPAPETSDSTWHWYLGNPAAEIGLTGSTEDLSSLSVPPEECRRIVTISSESRRPE